MSKNNSFWNDLFFNNPTTDSSFVYPYYKMSNDDRSNWVNKQILYSYTTVIASCNVGVLSSFAYIMSSNTFYKQRFSGIAIYSLIVCSTALTYNSQVTKIASNKYSLSHRDQIEKN